MTLATNINSVGAACAHVLLTADPRAKLMAARATARAWVMGRLAHRFDTSMPARPARPDAPLLLPPNQMPKRGRIGSERARIAMLHALAHIEFVAIDLAFDLIGRFGDQFPLAFTDEWMQVGAEEAMHFALLDRRLRQLGSHYGALPHMTACGRRPAKRRTMRWLVWRSSPWCWKPAPWTSRRPRSSGLKRRAT